jgi:hypothetical protein
MHPVCAVHSVWHVQVAIDMGVGVLTCGGRVVDVKFSPVSAKADHTRDASRATSPRPVVTLPKATLCVRGAAGCGCGAVRGPRCRLRLCAVASVARPRQCVERLCVCDRGCLAGNAAVACSIALTGAGAHAVCLLWLDAEAPQEHAGWRHSRDRPHCHRGTGAGKRPRCQGHAPHRRRP